MRRVIVFGGLLLLGLAFAKSFGAMDRDHREREAWMSAGVIPADGWLHVRNRDGSIRIEQATGDSFTIVASRSWTGRRPQDVAFIMNRVGSDTYVCAVYGGGSESDCDEDSYRNTETNWLKRRILRIRPVNVAFTVHAPASARINADTRDGRIAIDAPLAAVVANTRSGSIRSEKPVGSIEAHAREGSISAVIADGPLAGDVVLETRDGSVTLELPSDVNANLSLTSRHGRVSNEFDQMLATTDSSETTSSNHVRGVLGTGGRLVTVETRDGSIRLKRRPAGESEKVDSSTIAASGGSNEPG